MTDGSDTTTLLDELAPDVDDIRGMHAELGTRPYKVAIVWVSWSGGLRGRGTAAVSRELVLVPTPKVEGVSNLNELLTAAGRTESGDVELSEISLGYTEQQLAPQAGPAENVFYEITEAGRSGSRRRRFVPSGVPERVPAEVGWRLRLQAQDTPRTPTGRLA